MNEDTLHAVIFAVLGAIRVAGSEGAPEGHLYAGVMVQVPSVTLDWWHRFVDMLIVNQLANRHGQNVMTLTKKGEALFESMEQIYALAKEGGLNQ